MKLATKLAEKIKSRWEWPLLAQEMRISQRGARPFVVMFVYATVLSVVAAGTIYFMQLNPSLVSGGYYAGGPTTANLTAEAGRRLFQVLSMTQLAMIVLIVPAYTSGAVTAERERGTFESLAMTPLASGSIIGQKLAAALGQAALLLLVSVPVLGIVFMLGGVSPAEVAVAYALLVTSALMLAGLGLFCSCWLKSTRASTLAAYLITLVFVAGIPLFGAILDQIQGADAFALTLTLLLAFVVGVFALMCFGVVALMVRKLWRKWRVRAVRMCAFGVIYAVLLSLFSMPGTAGALIDPLYRDDIFLPVFVNPFFAMSVLMGNYQHTHGHYGAPVNYVQIWAIAATLVFAVSSSYLFKQLSGARFEALRRS